MNEREWLSTTDPGRMLRYLEDRASDRKLRLYLCALGRRVWPVLADEERRGVEVAERLADGRCDEAERAAAFEAASGSFSAIYTQANCIPAKALLDDDLGYYCRDASAAVTQVADADGRYILAATAEAEATAAADQCALLRELFGNPFRPVEFDPRWRTADAVGLAQAIYEEKAFDRLPLLADALMDAGCADEAVLAHCRSGGPHVRGCWVVDGVLDKT